MALLPGQTSIADLLDVVDLLQPTHHVEERKLAECIEVDVAEPRVPSP
jgi:hypothetical protein